MPYDAVERRLEHNPYIAVSIYSHKQSETLGFSNIFRVFSADIYEKNFAERLLKNGMKITLPVKKPVDMRENLSKNSIIYKIEYN